LAILVFASDRELELARLGKPSCARQSGKYCPDNHQAPCQTTHRTSLSANFVEIFRLGLPSRLAAQTPMVVSRGRSNRRRSRIYLGIVPQGYPRGDEESSSSEESHRMHLSL